MEGAHIVSESHSGTEKSLWEHYNELRAKTDARQAAVWHDMANSALIFVRLPSALSVLPVRLKSK